jgi:hypothetical protein
MNDDAIAHLMKDRFELSRRRGRRRSGWTRGRRRYRCAHARGDFVLLAQSRVVCRSQPEGCCY